MRICFTDIYDFSGPLVIELPVDLLLQFTTGNTYQFTIALMTMLLVIPDTVPLDLVNEVTGNHSENKADHLKGDAANNDGFKV